MKAAPRGDNAAGSSLWGKRFGEEDAGGVVLHSTNKDPPGVLSAPPRGELRLLAVSGTGRGRSFGAGGGVRGGSSLSRYAKSTSPAMLEGGALRISAAIRFCGNGNGTKGGGAEIHADWAEENFRYVATEENFR